MKDSDGPFVVNLAPPHEEKLSSGRKTDCWVVAWQLLLFSAMLAPVGICYFTIDPARRGFRIDDPSISWPIKRPEAVSRGAILSTVLLLPPFVISVVIFGVRKQNVNSYSSWKVWWQHNVVYLFEFGACIYFSELLKYITGRPRPDFLAICKPNVTGGEVYLEVSDCTGDEWEINDALTSFVSGHATLSTICSMFICIYLQTQLPPLQEKAKMLLPVLQTGFLSIALYMSTSRYTDNRHHWEDILLGIVIAVLVAFYGHFYFFDTVDRAYYKRQCIKLLKTFVSKSEDNLGNDSDGKISGYSILESEEISHPFGSIFDTDRLSGRDYKKLYAFLAQETGTRHLQ